MLRIEGVIEYGDAQLEQMAHDFLRKRPDVQFKIPVNVEALLETCADVDLDVVANLAITANHAGCVCRPENGPELVVYVDQRIADSGSKAQYNAVIAEELAHIELHRPIFMQVKSIEDFLEVQRSKWWHRMERDARFFSSALRMPFKNLVLNSESLYVEIIDEHGFGNISQTQKLLRNALADKFQVPPEDMHVRLMQWPCQLFFRVELSVQARSQRLLSTDVEIRVNVPRVQAKLFK